MYTIGQIAKRFALSRSTLLYYDTIGLLSPSLRSEGNYRLYSDADVARMEQIALYREAGLPLEAVRDILAQDRSAVANALQNRLAQIAVEMKNLREQQMVITRLLQEREARCLSRNLGKEEWIALLRATGLSEADMERWHREFERMAPEAHQEFLESLGIPADEIVLIRNYSKNG